MKVAKTSRSSTATTSELVPAKSSSLQRTGRTKVVYLRADLVGKFPNINHQPAPRARCKLSEETRNQLVSLMKLV